MHYDATNFHPSLTAEAARRAAFARQVQAIITQRVDPADAAAAIFKEVGELCHEKGYAAFWRRTRPLLWVALSKRSEAYEKPLSEALEQCGYLLSGWGYQDGWTLFEQEVRPYLCWPDSF